MMNWNGNEDCDFRENGPFAPHSQSILSVFIKVLKNEKQTNKKRIYLFFNQIVAMIFNE